MHACVQCRCDEGIPGAAGKAVQRHGSRSRCRFQSQFVGADAGQEFSSFWFAVVSLFLLLDDSGGQGQGPLADAGRASTPQKNENEKAHQEAGCGKVQGGLKERRKSRLLWVLSLAVKIACFMRSFFLASLICWQK